MPERPTSTVTFLFSDIDDPTGRGEHHPQQIRAAFSHQQDILREAMEANGGYTYKQVGQALQTAFPTAPQAVQAALDAQRRLYSEQGSEQGGELRVRTRMALHTGVTEERGDDYFGPLLNRVARLLAAAHGGQVLLTLASAELARDNLPQGATLKDLGEHRLKDLFRPEHVYQLVSPGFPSDFPPLKTLDNRPNNLPLQPTPFVGRDKEVGEVRDILCRDEVRLLTLTGPGGIGKTRLALQAAADLLDEFPDGVFFVPLAAITDPALVISAITHVLEVREQGGQPLLEVLKDYLRDKRMLLVLDNFEQLLGLKPNSFEAATSVADLLMEAAHLKVLATSRASLHLSVEQQYPVPALSLPPTLATTPMHTGPGQHQTTDVGVDGLTQYEAVALFISRAQSANPSFEVNNHNAPAVAEICIRLDGLPLAIELAAARIKILSPQAILERLQSSQGSQGSQSSQSSLKLLTGGGRDLPARQQTLRNTIEWSYDLLDDGEKELFRRLAVFVGGCTLDAVEMVCNAEGEGRLAALRIDVLDGVGSLVDKSLLYTVEGSGEPRYAMLETIHEFAGEKLQQSGELDALQKQHALYFMGFVEQVEPQMIGPNLKEWLVRLEEEHDNIRAVLRWAKKVGHERSGGRQNGNASTLEAIEVGLWTAGALWRFWEMRGYRTESRAHLRDLLELSEPGETGALAEPEQSRISEGQPAARPPVRRGVSPARAKAFNAAANLAHSQADYLVSVAMHEQSLALRRELGDTRGVAASLNNLGLVSYRLGNYTAAASYHAQSLAIKKELGDRWGMSSSLHNMGILAQQQGDFATARSYYEESLAVRKELGDKEGVSSLLNCLGSISGEEGDFDLARSFYEEGLVIQRELGDKQGIALSLNELGVIAGLKGDFSSGRPRIEESLALSREIGDKRGTAYSLSSLGRAAYMQGEYAEAYPLYMESMAMRQELGSKMDIANSLLELGAVQVGTKQAEAGSKVLGAADTLMKNIGAALGIEDRLIYERAIAAARVQLGDEAFEKAWQEGKAMSVEQAVQNVLEVGRQF